MRGRPPPRQDGGQHAPPDASQGAPGLRTRRGSRRGKGSDPGACVPGTQRPRDRVSAGGGAECSRDAPTLPEGHGPAASSDGRQTALTSNVTDRLLAPPLFPHGRFLNSETTRSLPTAARTHSPASVKDRAPVVQVCASTLLLLSSCVVLAGAGGLGACEGHLAPRPGLDPHARRVQAVGRR